MSMHVAIYAVSLKKLTKVLTFKNHTKMLSEYNYMNWVSYLGKGWCMVFSAQCLQDTALHHSVALDCYRVWFCAGVL